MNALNFHYTQLLRRPVAYSLAVGPFRLRVESRIPAVIEGLEFFYSERLQAEPFEFHDFHIKLAVPSGVRRWINPQVVFYFDGRAPFKPLPLDQAFAMFEWGLNWCISQHAHQYLMIHSAVVESNGHGAIMPGTPGAGKSTLCAALINRGWRLFSDELALLSSGADMLTPLARPVALKNESIDVIGKFAPDAQFGTAAYDTAKGTVSHLKPPLDSVRRVDEHARPSWIVFPRYRAGTECHLDVVSKGKALMKIAENSFNYSLLADKGFDILTTLVDSCDCYELTYSQLDNGIAVLDSLAKDSVA